MQVRPHPSEASVDRDGGLRGVQIRRPCREAGRQSGAKKRGHRNRREKNFRVRFSTPKCGEIYCPETVLIRPIRRMGPPWARAFGTCHKGCPNARPQVWRPIAGGVRHDFVRSGAARLQLSGLLFLLAFPGHFFFLKQPGKPEGRSVGGRNGKGTLKSLPRGDAGDR